MSQLSAAFDVATDPRKPSLAKIVEPEEIKVGWAAGCHLLAGALLAHPSATITLNLPACACRRRLASPTCTPPTAWLTAT